MATSERIPVAQGILQWARRTAGFQDVGLAAKRLGVKPEQLSAWESGARIPTVKQLRNLAGLYRRPFAVLLLPEPPTDFDALRDFRRTGLDQQPSWSPALHSEFKRALTQREVVLELAEIAPSTIFKSQNKLSSISKLAPEEAGSVLHRLVVIDEWASSVRRNPRKALRAAIEAVEKMGILVLQTRNVDISEMRGFSISEWPSPVVVLNGSDWPRPKLFTLMHELAHLGLSTGGLCDLHEERGKSSDTGDQTEHFCNQVAASGLIPKASLEEHLVNYAGVTWGATELYELSQLYPASTEALLLRLIDLGVTGWDTYRRLKPELEAIYTAHRAEERARQKASKSGPSYYVIKARNLGHGYVQSVLDAFHARAITSYDVIDYLDVKYDHLGKLQEAVQQ